MNDEVAGVLELLLDVELLVSAIELDDLLLLELLGALALIELARLELTTLELDLLLGADELVAPHKLPLTFGALAVPFA